MTPLFANPVFLWALPLAAVPVLFHLFLRARKRPRPFPTLMFFHRIDPRLSARKRLREWLILLLRMLFLLLLLLALARPRWFTGWGGGSIAVVLVVDNSGSMSQQPLSRAAEAASALLNSLDRNDTAGLVLLVDDPTVSLPAGLVADRAALKNALHQLADTEATGNVGEALRRAFALLDSSAATRGEVHIFTDLQVNEWAAGIGDVRAPRSGTRVVVHRITPPPLSGASLALASVELPQRRLLAGRPITARVVVRNTTTVDGQARLQLADDAGQQQVTEVAVPANSDKLLTLVLGADSPGFHWFHLWLDGDAFAADNRASIGGVCAEKSVVLFAGAPDAFGLLPVALSPVADGKLSGLRPQFTTPADLARAIAETKPLLVVMTGTPPLDYVVGGGNVLLVPAADAPVETRAEGWPVLVIQKSAAVFDDLRDAAGTVALRGVKAFRWTPIEPAATATALLGLEDGRAVVTEETYGQGRIFRSAIAFDPAWSTLPLKGGFLALAQSFALVGGEAGEVVTRLEAGERLVATGLGPLHIRSLAGGALDWKGTAAQTPVFPRAGVYAVSANGATRYVTVAGSPREGRPEFVRENNVPALAGLAHIVRTYTRPEELTREFRVVNRGVDLYLPLLLLALAMLLAEGWLANQPPRGIAGAPTDRVMAQIKNAC